MMVPTSPVSRLPQIRTPLIGREREAGDVLALIGREDAALVTLTGPGGVGKTRLAIEAAARAAHTFADGVIFVPLASVRDPGLVLPAVGRAVGIRETAAAQVAEVLQTALAERETLLLLDNFEQVVDAAPKVADLLAGCPGLTILSTSRERLHVSGECEYPVAPLEFPNPSAAVALDEVAESDAIRLFVTRAQNATPAFRLTEENAQVVVEICHKLDGLPLAIELAAARVKVFPPAALRDRLEHALPLLTGGGRDLPEHQQTMQTTIGWSYDLLSPAEQRFFRHLAVFIGGFTLEAFEAVCAPLDGPDLSALDALASLVDKSLVRAVETSDGARGISCWKRSGSSLQSNSPAAARRRKRAGATPRGASRSPSTRPQRCIRSQTGPHCFAWTPSIRISSQRWAGRNPPGIPRRSCDSYTASGTSGI
jgi:predicted ATPase